MAAQVQTPTHGARTPVLGDVTLNEHYYKERVRRERNARAARPRPRARAQDKKTQDQKYMTLKKQLTNVKSQHAKAVAEKKSLQSTVRMNQLEKLIEMRASVLFRTCAEYKTLLDNKQMKMDEKFKIIEQTAATEIDKIKNNMRDLEKQDAKRRREIQKKITFYKEREELMKSDMKENLQSWDDKLNDVKNKMLNTYHEMQRKEDAKIRSIENKIHAMREVEEKEKLLMAKETEKLQTQYNDLEKKVQDSLQSWAERNSELQAKIQNLERIAAQLDIEEQQHNMFTASNRTPSQTQAGGYVTYCRPGYSSPAPDTSGRRSRGYSASSPRASGAGGIWRSW